MPIICYRTVIVPTNTAIFEDSTGGHILSSDPSAILHYLLTSGNKAKLKAFWQLDLEITTLLKLLPPSCLTQLYTTHKLTYNGYRLFYIPGRVFSISVSGLDADFYSLSQFWSDVPSSEYPEPLSVHKTQSLADELMRTFTDLGVGTPKRLTSPVMALAGGLDVFPSSDTPSVSDTPLEALEAQEYALRADRPLWVSAYQLGNFSEGLHTYDLTGAHGFMASRLPDLRDFSFHKSKELDEYALYGFVRGKLTIDPAADYSFCHPITMHLGNTSANPTGKYPEDYYYLDTICNVYRYHLGTFKIKDGWYINTTSKRSRAYPFRNCMSKLYTLRSQSSLASSICKRTATGIVGKLIEHHPSESDPTKEIYGDLYNPLYHSIITNETSLAVFRFLIDNSVTPSELVTVGVDGCRLTRHIPLPTVTDLGQWRYSPPIPTIVLAPDRIYSADRNGRLPYSTLLSLIADHPRSNTYSLPLKRTVTLSQAVVMKDISAVGTIIDSPVTIDFNTLHLDQDRDFQKLPKTGEALLNNKYMSSAPGL